MAVNSWRLEADVVNPSHWTTEKTTQVIATLGILSNYEKNMIYFENEVYDHISDWLQQ